MSYNRSKFGTVTSQPKFTTGQFNPPASVGATFSSHFPLNSGVRLNPEGTPDIAIGHNSSVGLSGPNGGYILDSEVFIDVDDLEKVFVVASAAGATVSFVAS
jgi:hypothetical protein|tara:strand:- start:822 stop:1127 length:306 start_codon:yes stop_codon:yes gene_type:complete